MQLRFEGGEGYMGTEAVADTRICRYEKEFDAVQDVFELQV